MTRALARLALLLAAATAATTGRHLSGLAAALVAHADALDEPDFTW